MAEAGHGSRPHQAELTDAEVLEAQLVENLIQRREVHPMEEANGFRAFSTLGGAEYTVEQIAAKVGKFARICGIQIEADRPHSCCRRSVLCG